jgi:hypothetical protein
MSNMSRCLRCDRTADECINNSCSYHPGHVHSTIFKKENQFTCCKKSINSPGCTQTNTHRMFDPTKRQASYVKTTIKKGVCQRCNISYDPGLDSLCRFHSYSTGALSHTRKCCNGKEDANPCQMSQTHEFLE